MPNKIRINLAGPAELLQLPGIDQRGADAIVRYRAQHGPITDAQRLGALLGDPSLAERIRDVADFAPADSTAPEAPGA